MKSSLNDLPFDLTLRKNGKDFVLLHVGTGLHASGTDLNALYAEMEKKKQQYFSDIETVGAADLLKQSMVTNAPASRHVAATKVKVGLGLTAFFVKFLIVIFICAMALQFVAKKVDTKFKALELKVRTAFDEPNSPEAKVLKNKWMDSLKKADPYLQELKKQWNTNPPSTSQPEN